jgi:hypothetical protein
MIRRTTRIVSARLRSTSGIVMTTLQQPNSKGYRTLHEADHDEPVGTMLPAVLR